ncbi:MAG: HAD family hydrolase [Candidatus Obscuribacterales bacterium]|nr:HAD family hydrolase [Candidatus Obscuribacterales bacterium]
MQELKLNTQLVKAMQFEGKARTKLVVTDVDGTLASFWDYFVPAIRDFIKDVSTRTNKPALELSRDIGHVIERRGTHEYPWLLEETGFAWAHYKNQPEEFLEEFVKPFWKAVDDNRSRYLRPFPRVLETLQELKERGVKIVALSDAPDYMARVRNKQIFDGLLDAVYSLETVEPPKDDMYRPITLVHGRERVQALQQSTRDLQTRLVTLPADWEKPCPHGLDRVLSDFEVYPQECLFVGDSLAKDGIVAASRGIRFIWAHYGSSLSAEYEEIAYHYLKPDIEKGGKPEGKKLPTELIEAVAARYDEILNFV